jgi:hypothetical protein
VSPSLLEPESLISAFVAHPPAGFAPVQMTGGGAEIIGFVTRFDLTTTLDPPVKRILQKVPLLARAASTIRPRTLFVGTTVSEYLPLAVGADADGIVGAVLEEMGRQGAALAIFKDVPRQSPLFGAEPNRAAAELAAACRRQGFEIVSGQALAYVPIDFASEDDYLAKLSRARRKDLRRKLRRRALLEVRELRTGDAAFADDGFVDQLFRLYQNVYDQSLIHFDELSKEFFRTVLRQDGGIVFLYSRSGELIGYNLCFVHGERLVDKYVGFVYPQARDENLYFVSWFQNLDWARRHGMKDYVAGWTDPEVKSALGARFTFTDHAVYARSRLLRFALRRLRPLFESDANWAAAEAHAGDGVAQAS